MGENTTRLTETDRLFADLVVSQGLCGKEQVEECASTLVKLMETGVTPVPSLGQILVERGFLTSGQADRTLKTTRKSSGPVKAPTGLPEEAKSGEAMGKYVRTKKLGAGGMGEVWKAWDTELRRWVAMKFLKYDDPEELARFQREAQTAAKLNHPNIGAIYEVGEHDGKHYISMQFVDGRTLQTVPRDDHRKLAAMVRDAARAVHAAHESRVIHRDLKPANIMIEKDRIFVMDFGLAKETSVDSKVSVSGSILGTPAYMPPEQAQGKTQDVSERSDVYSLGATFYEMLADRPPFRGDNVYDVLRKVVDDDPKPLKRVNADLQTIVLKCLEKDPNRRYGSALELADDLNRFLDGEPIAAHPPSVFYRLRKKIAKRKGVAITATLGLLVAVTLAAVLLPRLWQTQSDLTKAQEELVRQMREISDAYLELALVARRNDQQEKMRAYAPKVESVCRKVMEEIPGLAEPHYRLGRMYRALMMDDDALRLQEEAIAKDGGFLSARYERIVLLSRRYLARVHELSREAEREAGRALARITGGSMKGGTELEVADWLEQTVRDDRARKIRDRMARDNLLLQKSPAEVSEAMRLCAQGIFLWVSRDFGAAVTALEAAIRENPDMEEAFEARAAVAFQLGEYRECIAWWTKAIERDRGYVRHYNARGRMRANLGSRVAAVGEDPTKLFAGALEDYKRSLDRDPDNVHAWRDRGVVHMGMGLYHAAHGRDPAKDYEAAIASFKEARSQDRTDEDPWIYLGSAELNWGLSLVERGEDPSDHYASAIRNLDEAIRIQPDRDLTWLSLGLVQTNLGIFRTGIGEDPTDCFQEAIRFLGEALKRNPKREETWTSRGDARVSWANHLSNSGKDPVEVLNAAIADFNEAIRLDSEISDPWSGRGNAYFNQGNYRQSIGVDPLEDFNRAVKDYTQALAINPARSEVWVQRGAVRRNLGHRRNSAGEDPSGEYTAAVQDLEEALKRNPAHINAWTTRATIRVNWGSSLGARGKDPSEQYRLAVEELDEALKKNAEWADFWRVRAGARLNWGSWLAESGRDPTKLYESALRDYGEAIRRNNKDDRTFVDRGKAYFTLGAYRSVRGGDPSEMYAKAMTDFDRALEINNRREEAWRSRGITRSNMGQWKAAQKADPTKDYFAAIRDFDQAIKLNPRLAASHSMRGVAHANWGQHRAQTGEDPSPLYAAALRDFDAAIKFNPGDATAWMFRGNVHANYGIWNGREGKPWTKHLRDAIASFEKAIELNPTLKAQLQGGIDQLRKMLGGK